jgi:TolA-binding protein
MTETDAEKMSMKRKRGDDGEDEDDGMRRSARGSSVAVRADPVWLEGVLRRLDAHNGRIALAEGRILETVGGLTKRIDQLTGEVERLNKVVRENFEIPSEDGNSLKDGDSVKDGDEDAEGEIGEPEETERTEETERMEEVKAAEEIDETLKEVANDGDVDMPAAPPA